MNKLMATTIGSVVLSMSLTGAAFASNASGTAGMGGTSLNGPTDRGIAPLMSMMPNGGTNRGGAGITDLNGNYHGTGGANNGGRLTPTMSDRTGNGNYRGTGTRDSVTPLNTTTNGRGTYRAASTNNNGNNNSNWGWLGLIGLLGLAGMRSRSGEQRR